MLFLNLLQFLHFKNRIKDLLSGVSKILGTLTDEQNWHMTPKVNQ